MTASLKRRGRAAAVKTATVFVGTIALLLPLAACAEPDSDEPAAEQPGEELVTAAGYDYADSQGDPTVAAVVGAYESYDALPPPVAVSEDFESGAGPFWQGADDTGSVTLTGGALRITNSDPDFAIESYAELDAEADSVFMATEFRITEPLQVEEGPALAVSRWEADELDIEYEFMVDGGAAYLFESTGPDPEDVRLLDSAAVSVPPATDVSMAMWVYSRGESGGIAGLLGDQAVVFVDGASGSFDSVALRVWSTGTPRTVDFQWAGTGALSQGEALPELFAGQSEYAVEQDGTQVATIAVLEPSDYLWGMPQFETDQCCSVLEETAPPGMTVLPVSIAGESIAQGELDGTTFWIWTREDHWNVVTAQDQAEGREFVQAYINAETTTAV
jgi:hypothetical protein